MLLASVDLFRRMGPYLLFGFFFAGLLHVCVPMEWIARHLGNSNFTSVLKAVIFGIPLPLCSCGVLPAALLLRSRGASRGAVLAFMIATPITGIDSIFATYALLGGPFTFYRILAACITALIAGVLTNWLLPQPQQAASPAPAAAVMPDCCHKPAKTRRSLRHGIRELARYAFVQLLGDIWRALLIGVLIGGAISYLVPESFISRYLSSEWISMMLMLLIGIPMYICATGSIPIAAALMLKGLHPGAALVFLLGGPATNAVTITIVARELGKRATVIYVGTIALISFAMGLLLNKIWRAHPPSEHAAHTHAQIIPAWLEDISALVLGALIIYHAARYFLKKTKHS